MTNLLASYYYYSDGAIVGIIFGTLLGLVISILIAVKTAKIAERKGYHYWGFFWLCIFIGILALIFVVIIEDRVEKLKREEKRHMELIRTIKEINVKEDKAKESKQEEIIDELFWVCKNCGSKNGASFTTCGRCGNKRKI